MILTMTIETSVCLLQDLHPHTHLLLMGSSATQTLIGSTIQQSVVIT